MSARERYETMLARCEQGKRLMGDEQVRRSWALLQESYLLLLRIEDLLGAGSELCQRHKVQDTGS